MRQDNAIPIRLDTETKERLKEAAEQLGLSVSALIRILIASFVRQFEASDGSVTLPLRWEITKTSVSPLLRPPRRSRKRA